MRPRHTTLALAALTKHHGRMNTFLLSLDLLGTFVFALSGGTLAARKRLDLFGVLVLSVAAAHAGGVLRDLLIGAVPPAALSDWRYPAVSLSAGLLCFFWGPRIERLQNPVRMFDALGLALFAVSGTEKALAAGLYPAMAAGLGMLTGIGGGIVRDLLLAEVPLVLRAELYAVAALAGASVVAMGSALGFPLHLTAPAGAALCFGLRMMALHYGWHLPMALQASRQAPSDNPADNDTPR